MGFEEFQRGIVEFIRANQAWAPFIIGAFAFGESLAIVSIAIPSTVILVGIGGLVAAGALDFAAVWWGAFIGAALGFTVSYWIGERYGPNILNSWPLNREPQMVERGKNLFVRWGVGGVLIGHFFGPLRAVAPLAAGIVRMPILSFEAANIAGAALWAYLVPKSGEIGGDALGTIWNGVRSQFGS